MPPFILGRKVGMTRYYTEDGKNIPVTVLQVGPCVVTQVKTSESDGYAAVQFGYEDVRPRLSTMPVIGHDAKAQTAPKRLHKELRLDDDAAASEFELGQTVLADVFADVKFVDVTSSSKGKGFQGGMKAWGFKGKEASHGVERKHRSPGSIGGHGSEAGNSGGVKKGKRMARRLGGFTTTTRNLDVISVDAERGLLIVKGTVPGPNRGIVTVREAVRLNRRKQAAVKAG